MSKVRCFSSSFESLASSLESHECLFKCIHRQALKQAVGSHNTEHHKLVLVALRSGDAGTCMHACILDREFLTHRCC